MLNETGCRDCWSGTFRSVLRETTSSARRRLCFTRVIRPGRWPNSNRQRRGLSLGSRLSSISNELAGSSRVRRSFGLAIALQLSATASDSVVENHLNELECTSMSSNQASQTWPELAIDLYDKLTGRDAEISYSFDNLEIYVPSSTSPEAQHAKWKFNGSLRISTRNRTAGEAKP